MQKDPSSIFNDKVKLESMSDLKRSYLERDLDMMVSAKKNVPSGTKWLIESWQASKFMEPR